MGSTPSSTPLSPRFVVIVALFITVLITANITAVKLVTISLPDIDFLDPKIHLQERVLPAAIIIFPLSYIMGDILTEVYGYTAARRIIWLGFFCNLVAVGAIWGGDLLPALDPEVGDAYREILGYAPRLLGASFAAYLVGEFINAMILSRMKLLTRGRWLWSRTIGSTLVGQSVDTVVFISLAFSGSVPGDVLREIILTQWLVKVSYETLATPLTYVVVTYLKRTEGMDAYDQGVSLSPIPLSR